MRIRITIEYDPDREDHVTPQRALLDEQDDWRKGNVNISDIEAIGEPNGKVKWEIIP